MQLQIVLIIILFNFSKILTQNEATKQNFKTSMILRDNSDIEDTPSPEWIKYQQERFQNLDKLPATGTKVNSKMETTSRQESYRVEEKEEQQQQQQSKCDKVVASECKKEKLSSSNAVEFPSIHGFIEFIKSFKETWMKNSLFRIEDKIKMLHQLKDTLLKTIEQQFMVLWQDDDDENIEHADDTQNRSSRKMSDTHIRNKRGILDESSINFPPNAALMSINFLTFAVFLIKLVLQVVNIIKTKHYQFSTMNMDTGAIRNG